MKILDSQRNISELIGPGSTNKPKLKNKRMFSHFKW